MAVKVNGQFDILMTKDGLQSIHVSVALQEIEREGMPEIMAAPSFHGEMLSLEDLNVLVNLAPTEKPSKLAHEHPV
jgi:hypothetical protein